MFSVASDPVASLPVQGPPSSRSAPAPRNDSFAAMVDGNAPADTSADRAQDRSAAQRRADDASGAAEDRRSRNNAAADRAARTDSDDRAAARQSANADADAGDDAAEQSRQISGSSKNDAGKSSEKPASGDTPVAKSAADRDEPVQKDGPAVATPQPVAAPIAVPITVAPAPAPAAPASGIATAPLAIAAAAIAASASLAGDKPAAMPAAPLPATPAAPSAQAGADSDTAASTSATAQQATAKITVQAASSEVPAAVTMSVTSTEAGAATNAAVAAAATAPVAQKAASLKASVATQARTAASDDADNAPGKADPSTIAPAVSTTTPAGDDAPPMAAASKAKSGNGIVDAAKADVSAGGSPASTARTSPHAHSAAPAGEPLADTSSATPQAAGTIQPQLHAGAISATHASALTATAATSDAVPLSGLAMQIAATASSGKSRFEIRLDPADLGRIDVRIDVDRNGHVTSHLMVEKAETLSMLRQDAPQLQRALDDAGFKTGDGGLQFSLRDQSSSGQNDDGRSGRNAHRLIVSEEDSIPAAIAGRTYGRMLGSSSGVDIKV